MKKKIYSENELVGVLEKEKQAGKVVVSTSGCFDLIHQGHVQYLREAKAKGDILVVFLNSDSSIRKLKGSERPIVDENGRMTVLSEFESVDYICLFADETPCRLIKLLCPDIFVKGGDYEGKHIPEMDVVNEYGGRVLYVSMINGCSTTNLIDRIMNSGEKYEG